MKNVSFEEIETMMSNAETYEDLYNAASLIVDERLQADVNDLIDTCETDEDDVETAYSIVASDLLDGYVNEDNIDFSLNEAKEFNENSVLEKYVDLRQKVLAEKQFNKKVDLNQELNSFRELHQITEEENGQSWTGIGSNSIVNDVFENGRKIGTIEITTKGKIKVLDDELSKMENYIKESSTLDDNARLAEQYKERLSALVTDKVISNYNFLREIIEEGEDKEDIDGYYFPIRAINILRNTDTSYHMNSFMDLTISDILNSIENNETVQDAIDEFFDDYNADSAYSWADNFITVLSKLNLDEEDYEEYEDYEDLEENLNEELPIVYDEEEDTLENLLSLVGKDFTPEMLNIELNKIAHTENVEYITDKYIYDEVRTHFEVPTFDEEYYEQEDTIIITDVASDDKYIFDDTLLMNFPVVIDDIEYTITFTMKNYLDCIIEIEGVE